MIYRPLFPTFLQQALFAVELCNEFYYGKCVKHLTVNSIKHIGISPLTNKRAQQRMNSVARYHLIFFNYPSSFERYIFFVSLEKEVEKSFNFDLIKNICNDFQMYHIIIIGICKNWEKTNKDIGEQPATFVVSLI